MEKCHKMLSLFFSSINLSEQFQWRLHINERIFRDSATSMLTKVVTLIGFNDSFQFEFGDSECTECLESYQEIKSKADWIQCKLKHVYFIFSTRSGVTGGEWKSK